MIYLREAMVLLVTLSDVDALRGVSMKKFRIEVSDRKNVYPSRIYDVEASQEFEAYGPATDQFIRDNNHPPRKNNQRISSYLQRFWNRAV